MRRKLVWVLVLALGAAVGYAGSVIATPGAAFTGTTLAKTTYAPLFSHIHTTPATWDELIKTKGNSDLYVQQNTWDPSQCDGCVPNTGWHTHPGPSFVIVTEGSVTVYDSEDPDCTPFVFTAGTANNSFVDDGGGHVHMIRNETGVVARTIAVQLIPAGAVRRQDAPDPGTCDF